MKRRDNTNHSSMIPKAKNFSARLKWTLIIGGVMFVGVVGWMFFGLLPSNSRGWLNVEEKSASSLAAENIRAIDANPVPPVLLNNWPLLSNGQKYLVYSAKGQRFAKMNGQDVPLQNGHSVMREGKHYRYDKGQRDGVMHNNHFFQVDADGSLHAYKKILQPGQVVWQDDKRYVVGQDGSIHLADGSAAAAMNEGRPMSAASHQAQGKNLQDVYRSTLIAYQEQALTQQKDSASSDAKDALESKLAAIAESGKAMAQSMRSTNAYAEQNGQAGNAAFLQADQASPTMSKSHLQHPTSPYTLYAGTIIPAALQTGINSDLPGKILARVTEDVFDTRHGNYLLVPQGTLIEGVYDASVAYGQSRVLVVFTRLLFPNGTSMSLDHLPGADLRGYAGVTGRVNNHYARIFGSAAMFSIFSALGQLSQPKSDSDERVSNQQIIYAAVGQELTRTAAQMLKKTMNIQPTITANPGANFTILLTRDMVFPGAYHYD